MTGGGYLNNLLFSVKSSIRKVADMIIKRRGSFLLQRNGTILDSSPINISVKTLLSCASSTMITEYFDKVKSLSISFNNTPKS